jgi:hypothetical protein
MGERSGDMKGAEKMDLKVVELPELENFLGRFWNAGDGEAKLLLKYLHQTNDGKHAFRT